MLVLLYINFSTWWQRGFQGLFEEARFQTGIHHPVAEGQLGNYSWMSNTQ